MEQDVSYPLDHDEYQRNLAERMVRQSRVWFPELWERPKWDLVIHTALGLAGETGELVNLIKKANRANVDGSTLDREATANELADCFIYLSEMAYMLDVDLIQAVYDKERILYKRWGNPNKGTVDG